MASKKTTTKSDMVHEIFEHWSKVLKHPRGQLDAKRTKKIVDRLNDGYSVDDLKCAIDGCRASPWHMGANDRKTVYDSIDLIFRNADHVDRFMRMGQSAREKKTQVTMTINVSFPPATPAVREKALAEIRGMFRTKKSQ